MNKKGFTLIELLAVIIIIGVIATIAIASVASSVSRSKDETFVNLAKNYAEAVRGLRTEDKMLYSPKNNEAVIIPYSEINNVEINNKELSGYGHILPSYSFIGIVNNNNNYSYYINQVDDTYHVLDRVEYNAVSNDDVTFNDNISSIKEIKTPLASFNINYNNSNYTIKAVGVEYDANYVRNGNTKFITSFDLYDSGTKLKGILTLNNWSGTSSNKSMELKVINNGIGGLNNQVYTFKKNQSGGTGVWNLVDSSGNSLTINGKSLTITVNNIGEDTVSFDFRLGTYQIPGILATTDTKLYGYFTSDNSYATSNFQIKGNISSYDNFASTGKFQPSNSNTITIDGINYKVNSSKISYIVVVKK